MKKENVIFVDVEVINNNLLLLNEVPYTITSSSDTYYSIKRLSQQSNKLIKDLQKFNRTQINKLYRSINCPIKARLKQQKIIILSYYLNYQKYYYKPIIKNIINAHLNYIINNKK